MVENFRLKFLNFEGLQTSEYFVHVVFFASGVWIDIQLSHTKTKHATKFNVKIIFTELNVFFFSFLFLTHFFADSISIPLMT